LARKTTSPDSSPAPRRQATGALDRFTDGITADDCPYGVPAATNLALLSRYFADQAVSAKRLDFAANRRLPD
jgi:hypothetical protein